MGIYIRCTCGASIDGGVMCAPCREVVMDYNRDLIDKEDEDALFVDENDEEILP